MTLDVSVDERAVEGRELAQCERHGLHDEIVHRRDDLDQLGNPPAELEHRRHVDLDRHVEGRDLGTRLHHAASDRRARGGKRHDRRRPLRHRSGRRAVRRPGAQHVALADPATWTGADEAVERDVDLGCCPARHGRRTWAGR